MYVSSETTVRLRDGTTRLLHRGESVPDGAVVIRARVPLLLKDGASETPPGAQVSEAEVVAAHRRMCDHIQNAWKRPPAPQDAPLPGQTASPEAPAAPARDAAEAHQRMRDRISNAWKQGRPEQPRPPTARNLWTRP